MKNTASKKYLFLILLGIFSTACELNAQRNTNSLEIEIFLKWDKYPTFTNNINVIAKYKMAIRDEGWVVNAKAIF